MLPAPPVGLRLVFWMFECFGLGLCWPLDWVLFFRCFEPVLHPLCPSAATQLYYVLSGQHQFTATLKIAQQKRRDNQPVPGYVSSLPCPLPVAQLWELMCM
jgi:hypothetical protein